MKPARPGFTLLRRSALGLWLGVIAMLGMFEFRRSALIDDVVMFSPLAWMWLVGSTVTGLIALTLLVRALMAHRRSLRAQSGHKGYLAP